MLTHALLFFCFFLKAQSANVCVAPKNPSSQVLKKAKLGALPIPPHMLTVLAYYVKDLEDFGKCVGLMQEAFTLTQKFPVFKINTVTDKLTIIFDEPPALLPADEFLVSDEATALFFLKTLRASIQKSFSQAWKTLVPIKESISSISDQERSLIANVITEHLDALRKSHYNDVFLEGHAAYNTVCSRAKDSPNLAYQMSKLDPLDRARLLCRYLRHIPANQRDLLSSDQEAYALNHFLYVIAKHPFVQDLLTHTNPKHILKPIARSDIAHYIEHQKIQSPISATDRFTLLMKASLSNLTSLQKISRQQADVCLNKLQHTLELKKRVSEKSFKGSNHLDAAYQMAKNSKTPFAFASPEIFKKASLSEGSLDLINWDLARWIERFLMPTFFTLYPGLRKHTFWCTDIWSAYIKDPLDNDMEFNGIMLTAAAYHLAHTMKEQKIATELSWTKPKNKTDSRALVERSSDLLKQALHSKLPPRLQGYASFLQKHISKLKQAPTLEAQDFWVHDKNILELLELNHLLAHTHPNIADICVQQGILEQALDPSKVKKISNSLERFALQSHERLWEYILNTLGRALALPPPKTIQSLFQLSFPWPQNDLAKNTFALLTFLSNFISQGFCHSMTDAYDMAASLERLAQIKLILLFKKDLWPQSFYIMARKVNIVLNKFLQEHLVLHNPQTFYQLTPPLRRSTMLAFSGYVRTCLRILEKYTLSTFVNDSVQKEKPTKASSKK